MFPATADPGCFTLQDAAAFRVDQMIRTRTLRSAARLLLATLIAAFATVSLHAGALAPPASADQAHAEQALAAAAGEEHCHEQATDTSALQCKYHCQSAVQTLDHPDVRIPAATYGAFLLLTALDVQAGHAALPPPSSRPQATHHGGAPQPYRSTARLRI
jgi:hypothetical protein